MMSVVQKETRTAGPLYPIASVDSALRILLMFRGQRALRLTDAARSLGVAHSTAHRLLAMLQHYGFVQRDPDSRRYFPGPSLVEIGLSAVGTMDLRTYARPFLERVAEDVGETAYLAILEGRNLVWIDSAESSNLLRLTSRTGQMAPAFLLSAGRVLLAELPDGAVAQLYAPGALPQTTRWIKTRDQLEAVLRTIRARQYEVNVGDPEPGISSVSVVIRDRLRRARAALTIGAPEFRLPAERMESVAMLLLRTAATIAEGLD
jgi:IclR family acetate operon transcriptional repressor